MENIRERFIPNLDDVRNYHSRQRNALPSPNALVAQTDARVAEFDDEIEDVIDLHAPEEVITILQQRFEVPFIGDVLDVLVENEAFVDFTREGTINLLNLEEQMDAEIAALTQQTIALREQTNALITQNRARSALNERNFRVLHAYWSFLLGYGSMCLAIWMHTNSQILLWLGVLTGPISLLVYFTGTLLLGLSVSLLLTLLPVLPSPFTTDQSVEHANPNSLVSRLLNNFNIFRAAAPAPEEATTAIVIPSATSSRV